MTSQPISDTNVSLTLEILKLEANVPITYLEREKLESLNKKLAEKVDIIIDAYTSGLYSPADLVMKIVSE